MVPIPPIQGCREETPHGFQSRGCRFGARVDMRARAMVPWRSLGACGTELRLRYTLETGQTFRWRRTGDAEYTGVVGTRLVQVRQDESDVRFRVLARAKSGSSGEERGDQEEDVNALTEYFNLGIRMEELGQEFARADNRFRKLQPFFPGARLLRQDPLECLMSFVCSSNNNIVRIQGMVEKLCAHFGTPILQEDFQDEPYYAFPSLEQLNQATEQQLRALGFGYRASFITGTVRALNEKPEGGREWLHGLRKAEYRDAQQALCALPGVGMKVAACACLFSLDKHQAIPVDTHVWQLAKKYYAPQIKAKSLTPKVHAEVEQAFIDRFGPYAGWAHNTLFVADLAKHKDILAEAMRAPLEPSTPEVVQPLRVRVDVTPETSKGDSVGSEDQRRSVKRRLEMESPSASYDE